MDERIADIENTILRSSLSAEDIAYAYGVSIGYVKMIMKDLLVVSE